MPKILGAVDSPHSAVNQKYLDSRLSAEPAVPVGAIAPFGGTVAPANWLMCEGAAVSRELYSELFGVIGTAFGAGDGSTTFNVPDLRGEFLRGLAAGRTIGSRQGDAIRNVEGYLNLVTYDRKFRLNAVNYGGCLFSAAASASVPYLNDNNSFTYAADVAGTVQINLARVVPTANENRPRNVAVNYIIKARPGGAASQADFSSSVNAVNSALESRQPRINYSTDEQDTGRQWVDGKKIYQKVVYLGALPNNGTKEFPDIVGGLNVAAAICIYGVTNTGLALPCINNTTSPQYNIEFTFHTTALRVTTHMDRTTMTAHTVLEYTCTNR